MVTVDQAVESGLQTLRELEAEPNTTNTESCRCGAIVKVPKGMDTDEADRLCEDCDNPLGLKLYRTFARPDREL